MNSAWISTLEQLEPNYHYFAKMIEEGPTIVARLEKSTFKKWIVHIAEDWYKSKGNIYYTASYNNRDICVDWATEQLKNWKFVNRISHDKWIFLRKQDAEKFITLFNLKWGS